MHPDASIHPSAQVDAASCIIGPKAVIEAGAKLTDTIVWPSATVSEGSPLEGAIVTGS